MSEARTRLSEIVRRVQEGKEVILMNRGEPVARVVPLLKKRGSKRLGFAKDIEILPGFKHIPEEFENYT